jgi:hypothetical protein
MRFQVAKHFAEALAKDTERRKFMFRLQRQLSHAVLPPPVALIRARRFEGREERLKLNRKKKCLPWLNDSVSACSHFPATSSTL